MRNNLTRLPKFNQLVKRATNPTIYTASSIVGGVRKNHSFLDVIIPKTSPSIIAGQRIRQYTQMTTQAIKAEDIQSITLFPDREGDFQIFKKIITNEAIIFTSSFVDENFGSAELKDYCSDFKIILDLAKKGRREVFVKPRELQDYQQGKSPTQIAIDYFFSDEQNDKKLREIYEKITLEAPRDLGYYKFVHKADGRLLGGGALMPLETENGLVTVAYITVHILEPGKGIGTICLDGLLNDAFEKHKVHEVQGSYVMQNLKTPTLCAGHGMIMVNEDGNKYYVLTDEMRRLTKGLREMMRSGTISAADKFFTDRSNVSNDGQSR